jgi:hypothetical protein
MRFLGSPVVRGKPSLSATRMAICNGCEFRKVILGTAWCRRCGCNLGLKTRMESEHCPIGKW